MKVRENMVSIEKTLGSYLRELRKSSTFSLKEVESRTLISKSTLSEYENDKHIPTETNLKKLATLYQIDIEKLYYFIQLKGIPIVEKAHVEQVFNNRGEVLTKMVFDDALFPLTDIDQYYFTRKETDDLNKIGIMPNSLVLYRYVTKIKDKEIGIFKLHHELVMRQIEYINDDLVYLVPHSFNPKYTKEKVKQADLITLARVEKVISCFTI